MNGEDCRIGKDFNEKTCRYIKGCRNGYSRNMDFKCVKDTSGTLKKRSYAKEHFGLMKDLFSNIDSNGLFNSPPSRRGKTKRLRSNGTTLNLTRSKGTKKNPFKSQTQTLKDMRRFIENIGPRIVKMNSPEVFDLARKEDIELGNFNQKYLFRKCILAYIATLQPKSKSKRKISKKVKFQEPETNELNRIISPLDSPPPPESRSKIVRKKTNPTVSKPKASRASKPTVSKSSNPKISRPKSLTKNEKEKLIIAFLNKIGIRISELTMRQIKEIARPQGIALDTESYVEQFKKLAREFIDSYENMNMKYALMIMNVNQDYTLDQIVQSFREKLLALFPEKSFEEKKQTEEFIRLQNAFEFLKERLENNNFQHVSIEVPSDGNIINIQGDGLYTPDTTFLFYSKSSDAVPGKVTGEKIKHGDQDKYIGLSKIKDWRKKLSNFWISPFELEGKKWQSVEHYYQGSKFKGTPDFYNQFSLDSNSEISRDPALAKAAGGKTGKFKSKIIRAPTIKMDEGYFPDRSKIEMYKAQHAKFTQNDELMRLLKLTRDAKLVHHTRGSPPVVFDNLMYIRSNL
jgi:predicted NAD-dependent protein-ADP-ribosyltransferase YbiA (DUF1768 family)